MHDAVKTLSHAESLASPCRGCAAPCCSLLPLDSWQARSLTDLDHFSYLLNFGSIALTWSQKGLWEVYFEGSCRFLDPESHLCQIHGDPERPHICDEYSPYQCFYKPLAEGRATERVLVGPERMEFILSRVRFDKDRRIVEMPEWDDVLHAFAEIPYFPTEPAPAPSFPEPSPPEDDAATAYDELLSPCQDCAAPCCQFLVFNKPIPTSVRDLDYFKFCLGFPGVELGIADNAWSLVVQTPCRHLDGERCGIYGQPERPLACRFYSALGCWYKRSFSDEAAAGFYRVGLGDFGALTGSVQFNPHGDVLKVAPLAELRAEIERRRAGAGAPVPETRPRSASQAAPAPIAPVRGLPPIHSPSAPKAGGKSSPALVKSPPRAAAEQK